MYIDYYIYIYNWALSILMTTFNSFATFMEVSLSYEPLCPPVGACFLLEFV